jgi:hypothetical protein
MGNRKGRGQGRERGIFRVEWAILSLSEPKGVVESC